MNLLKNNQKVLFPSIFDEFLRPDWAGGLQTKMNIPAVNILENENSFEIQLESAGRKKEDFKLEIDNQILTISSETKSEVVNDVTKFTRKEFSLSAFTRSFTLPESVNEDEVKANYENGILTIELPKKEEALPKPKKLIEIA
jgi:HSP20 family protein